MDGKRPADIQAQKPGEEQPCKDCENCAGLAAVENKIRRAIDKIGFGMVWCDKPFPYTYTIGAPNDMVYVIAGYFEPIEFNDLMQEIAPVLIARHADLADGIAANGIIRITGLRIRIELQSVRQEYIDAGLFYHAQIRTQNSIKCVQIIVSDNDKLPEDPEYEGVAQVDLMNIHLWPGIVSDSTVP